MSDEEYSLNCQIHQEAKEICEKQLLRYFLGELQMPAYLAIAKTKEFIRNCSKEDLKRRAALALTQFQQEETEAQ